MFRRVLFMVACFSLSGVTRADEKPHALENVEALAPVKKWAAHENGTRVLGFTPDGKSLVTAGGDMFIRIWDTTTWKLQKEISCQKLAKIFVTAALSPDGKKVAMVGYNGVTHAQSEEWNATTIFDLIEGIPTLPPFNGHSWYAKCLSFSADSKLLITGSDRRLILRDIQSGKVVWQRDFQGNIHFSEVKFSGEDKAIFAFDRGEGHHIYGVEPRNGKQLVQWYAGHGAGQAGFSISRDDETMVTFQSYDEFVRIWDFRSGVPKANIRFGTLAAQYALFTPCGRYLMAGSLREYAGIWEVASGRPLARLSGFGDNCGNPAISPNGELAVLGGWAKGSNNEVLVWDLRAWRATLASPAGAALNPSDLWERLANPDAREGQRAVQDLAKSSEQSIELLERRLCGAFRPDMARIAQFVRELDDDNFRVRKAARPKLESYGKWVDTELIFAAQQRDLSVETRIAIHELSLRPIAPDELRLLRGVQVLELIGNKEAIRVLRKLVGIGSRDFLGKNAAQALVRLQSSKSK